MLLAESLVPPRRDSQARNDLEGLNAEFIHMNLPQGERLKRLNQIAIRQMQTLTAVSPKALPGAK